MEGARTRQTSGQQRESVCARVARVTVELGQKYGTMEGGVNIANVMYQGRPGCPDVPSQKWRRLQWLASHTRYPGIGRRTTLPCL
jgi:hypothetical protein